MKAKVAPERLQENSVRGRNSNVAGKQVSDHEESCIAKSLDFNMTATLLWGWGT